MADWKDFLSLLSYASTAIQKLNGLHIDNLHIDSCHSEDSEKGLSESRSEPADHKCRVGWRTRKVPMILNLKIFKQIKHTPETNTSYPRKHWNFKSQCNDFKLLKVCKSTLLILKQRLIFDTGEKWQGKHFGDIPHFLSYWHKQSLLSKTLTAIGLSLGLDVKSQFVYQIPFLKLESWKRRLDFNPLHVEKKRWNVVTLPSRNACNFIAAKASRCLSSKTTKLLS